MSDATLEVVEFCLQRTLQDFATAEMGGPRSPYVLDFWADQFKRLLGARLAMIPPDPPRADGGGCARCERLIEHTREAQRQLRAGVPPHMVNADLIDAIIETQQTLFG